MGRHCFLKLETFFFPVGINSLIIITTFSAESVSYPYWQHEACRPKNCGTGPNITYPFYVADNETDFCGYPGFKVSCEAKKPVCWTSLSDYFTEDIFYQYNSFSLVNVQVINSRCPASLHDIAFDSSPFQFGPNFVDHYLFYNCSNLFPSNYSQYQITCASNATDNSFAYLDARTDGFTCSQFPCELSVHAPVDIQGVALPSVKTVVAIVGSTTAIVYAFAMMDLMANVAIMAKCISRNQKALTQNREKFDELMKNVVLIKIHGP
ncbi:hypothetical protein CsSME_00022449 [Camellia sinensis var. sinensis]|uniref:Wall-associated receptor kinase galacturonan-binding domain-containing protein n=1 Tax=Camellia sinensis var. sinensis TaxID=542762 RepID=A0A4S4DAA8_CAMSN|nr:hypothetical protein TEA_016437 [Camellia sinensis var. sinensis]